MADKSARQLFDIEIEQAVLGAMLRYPERHIDPAAAELEARHFYDPLHQRLFDMVVHLQTEGDVTPLVVASVMKTDPANSEMNVAAYIPGLAQACPAMPNVREYSRILRDLAFRRDLVRIGEDLARAAVEAEAVVPSQELADFTTEELLQAGSDTAKPVLSPYEIAMETVREMEAVATGKPIPIIKTGLAKLDREIGGLRAGDLITVLGKSGMGKSALMGALALNFARQNIPTIVFSLEMTRNQWVERTVCDLDFDTAEKPMWYSRVRNHRLSDGEFDRFVLGSQHLQGMPLEIRDEDGLTMAQILARARAFAAKHGKKDKDGNDRIIAVLIDYLQIVEPVDNREIRERQVARIARAAKALAKRVGVVIAGSQMNENDEGRVKEERRPRASDARESKAIMNESDLMLSPYRPVVAVENRKPMEAKPGDPAHLQWQHEVKEVRHRFELLGLKNRHGRRFDLELWADMGASAIRDEEPDRHAYTPEGRAAADLLDGLG